MQRRVVVIGSGMGGLTAAIRLAQHGWEVLVVEARATPGGLTSPSDFDGFPFDSGPYILLDRPGLDWVFEELGFSLDEHLELHRVSEVYEVSSGQEPPVRIDASLEATAHRLDERWPGSGQRYVALIQTAWSAYRRLQPLQRISRIGPWRLIRAGVWRDASFWFRSLGDLLRSTGLPEPVRNAIGIWTHVAGQSMGQAPAPLAFVPALIHHLGAWYPVRGIGEISHVLVRIAEQVGVKFRWNSAVTSIRCDAGVAHGVFIGEREFVPADAVVSNAHGVGTYLQLLRSAQPAALPRKATQDLEQLPLQSPGVCAYLAVKHRTPPPYLRFMLPEGGELCRLLITPSALPIHSAPGNERERADWWPARLMAPMDHRHAESGGVEYQQKFLERILAESWWQDRIGDCRVVGTRLPCDWGREFHLHQNSMNPVMTRKFMRAGRLAHRSPYLARLYLAGSSTHPGQWISFAATSGILAADCLRKDLG